MDPNRFMNITFTGVHHANLPMTILADFLLSDKRFIFYADACEKLGASRNQNLKHTN